MTMGLFFVWMFLWDDEIDKEIDPDVADCASDFVKAEEYRNRSVEFVYRQLVPADQRVGTSPVPPTDICKSFEDSAPEFLKAGEKVHIQRFKDDLRDFMMSSAAEQEFRLAGKLPDVDTYWKFRLGTGGVDAICTLHQYGLKLSHLCGNRKLPLSN